MKSVATGFPEVLASEDAKLAHLWVITRTDGQSFYLTDHDSDIVLAGHTFKAPHGTVSSAVSYNRTLEADNMESTILLDSDEITRDDLLAGLFDDAEVDVYLVDATNALKRMVVCQGWTIGKVGLTDVGFQAELLSKASKLDRNIVEVYSRSCRAKFCDPRCKLYAGDYTKTGTVIGMINDRKFIDTTRTETSDVFAYGLLTWTSGLNAGYSMEVKDFNPFTKIMTLFLPMRNQVRTSDTYSVLQGCAKDPDACKAYGNIKNFRGEPFVPGSGVLPITKDPGHQRTMWTR